MPTLDVQKMRAMGKNDAAITSYAQQNGLQLSEPITAATPQAPAGRAANPIDRGILSFGTGPGRDAYIKKNNIDPNQINKPGFDIGDVTSKLGGILPFLGSMAAVPGALAGGILGAPAGPIGAVAGGVAGGGIGGAVGSAESEAVRQNVGKLLGVGNTPATQPGGTYSAGNLKDQAVSGGIGGLLQLPGTALIEGTLGRVASAPVRKMISALNPSPSELRMGMVPAEDFVKQGYSGTLDMMKKQAQTVLEKTKPIVDKAKAAVGSRVVSTGGDIVDKLGALEKSAYQAADVNQQKTLGKFFSNVVDLVHRETKGTFNITVETADKIRAAMDANLADAHNKARIPGVNLPDETTARKAVADLFRNLVNTNLTPEAAKANAARHTAALMLGATTRGATKRGLLNTIGLQAAGLLGGAAAGLGAQAAGASVPMIIGAGAAGRVGTVEAAKALQSPAVRTMTGQALRPAAAMAKKILAHPQTLKNTTAALIQAFTHH